MKPYTEIQLTKITARVSTEYPGAITQIKNAIAFAGIGETVEAYIAEYIGDYVKYDQGSLSFTITALRYSGRNPSYGIMGIIDSVLK